MFRKNFSPIFTIAFILVPMIIASCASSPPTCEENSAEGNLGGLFNTPFNEYSPVFFDEKLYFTAVDEETGEDVVLYSQLVDGIWTGPVSDESLPFDFYEKSGVPTFFYNPDTGRESVIFAAMAKRGDRLNSDLFIAEKVDGIWTGPEPLPEGVNTFNFESNPAVSEDGRYIFFVSDRPGGFGGLDIYYIVRENGSWKGPFNAGAAINTIADETTPNIHKSNSLFFASNGHGGFGGMDIISARFDGEEFSALKIYPPPVNSPADDTGPEMMESDIILASGRRGGCGGKDIYRFRLCGPVSLKGYITSETGDTPLEGKFVLKNENNLRQTEYEIGNDGKIPEISLEPNLNYTLRYYNSCIPNYVPEQRITAPCNDSNSVSMIATFLLPYRMKKYDFELYKVPFFVTGYYRPNTAANLDFLRNKFETGEFGDDPSTAYIENPGQKYDEYAVSVEQALNEAAGFIYRIIENLSDECRTSAANRLSVDVTGFADPRPLSDKARYSGPDIYDEEFSFEISSGTPMDNLLLSRLRAYYTARFIDGYLSEYNLYSAYRYKIRWTIRGLGEDQSKYMDNDLKRRVVIEIGVDNE